MGEPGGTDDDARADRRRLVFLVAAAVVVLAPGLFYGAPGGKSVVGALRILRGEVPYRDFWTMYAPGQFYLVAGLFAVFGAHLLVQGIATIAINALCGGALFSLLRRIGVGRTAATVVAALLVAANWQLRPGLGSYEPALLLLLLGIGRTVAYLRGGPPRDLLVAGALAGAAACFKHDVAFHVALATSAALVLGWFAAGARRPETWIPPLAAVARVAVGSVAVLAVPAALVAWSAGPEAWQDLFVFPATDFPIVMGQDYPGLLPSWDPLAKWLGAPFEVRTAMGAADAVSDWGLCNFPQVVALAGGVWLVRRRTTLEPWAFATAALCLAAIPLFWLSAHVQQNTHPASMALFSLLLGAVAWAAPRTGAVPGSRMRRWFALGFGVYAAVLLVKPAGQVLEIALYWGSSPTLEFPIARGIRVRPDMFACYDPVVRFVRRHVPPDEPIYCGVVRHDAIVINNQTFYYLAERPVAVRWNELHPALADSPDVQREIIASLESKGVRCVVLWKFGWPDAFLDEIKAKRRTKLPHLGATLLDEYLRREYAVIETHGEFQVCWRKDAGPPEPYSRRDGVRAPR